MPSDQKKAHSPLKLLEEMSNAPDLFHVYRYWDSHPAVTRVPGGWEYEGKTYPDYLTVGGASHAIFRVALKYCRGEGVDIGAGLWPLPGATPIDSERGEGKENSIESYPDNSLDFIFSSHCLEHVEDWQGALDCWLGKLKPSGNIFLYLPHEDCGLWLPGSPFVGDGHKWIPKLSILEKELLERGYSILDSDAGPDAMMSFFICASKPTE